MTEHRADLRFKMINFQDVELSPLALRGVRYYEDCVVGFRTDDNPAIDISVRLGLDHPDLPIERVANDDPMNQRFQIWQPEIYRGLRSWEPNYRQPSHGLNLNPQIIQGLREGSMYDIFDYAVAPVGSVLGASVEINGVAFDLALSHEKPLTNPRFRPVRTKSDLPKGSLVEQKGPRKRTIEKVFSRSGLMVVASYREFPYGYQLGTDEGDLVYFQLPSRFHRLDSLQGNRGVVRLKGLTERMIDTSGNVSGNPETIETLPMQLLNIVVFEATEDLIPFSVEKVTSYKSAQEYIKKIASRNGRCPVSGHILNPNATEADFGAIIRAKNRLVINPEDIATAVQFNLAIIGTNKQAGFEPYGITIDTCPRCFPTRCYGAHEKEDEATICPDCNSKWDEGHICLVDMRNILPEYFQAGAFSEEIEQDENQQPSFQIKQILN